MSRDGTRTRDSSAGSTPASDRPSTDVDGLLDGNYDQRPDSQEQSTNDSARLRAQLASRSKRLVSPRAFLGALALAVGGLFAANTLIPLPGAGVAGVFLATFLFGLVVEERRYAETAAAGGVAVGISTIFDFALLAILGGFGISLAVVGGAVGTAIGALGTYFGRDLRDGLTRDI